jgi:glutathione S-transferase
MKLYGFPLSPFVRKVALVLAEKGLDFDWVPSNPNQPDAEFSAASPFHKIPAFADGDFLIADSTAIITYLDAAYPAPALLPAAAKARGRAVWFDEVADTVLTPAGAPIVLNRFLKPKIFGTDGDEEAALAAEQAVLRPLDYLESQLGEDGWLDGEVSLGDFAVASVIKTLSYTGWSLDAGTHPKLAAWFARMTDRPSWPSVATRESGIFAALAH